MEIYSKIDIEALRNDLEEEYLAAYFAGGFGAALIESCDIKKASDEEVITYAKKMGVSLDKYRLF